MYLLWFLSWYLLGYDSSDDSCLSSYYDSYYRPLIIIVTFPVLTSYDLHLWFYTLGYSVAWDKGIYMRVSLFGLFLRCTSLMGSWPKRIKSLLLIISFTLDFLFHVCYTCTYIWFMSLSHLATVVYYLYVLIPWICIFRFRSLEQSGAIHRGPSY